ncbi:MAG: response regulator [Syntrophales bacterium]|nr:response regulator [Syntrophales bacterium]
MEELKYDVRRGADTYRLIYHSRLKSWILKGIIKRDEAIVWRSGLSGWRKPEELEELIPFFEQRQRARLRREMEVLRPAPPPKRQIKNVLIVDDEEDLCWLLTNTLQSKGYNVSTADGIIEGMACLKNKSPDLVFIDLKLPDGDGMDMLPEIKVAAPQTVVVIISAYGSEEKRAEAEDRGVHSFIDKPFTEERILETIAQFQERNDHPLRGTWEPS